MVRHFRLLIQIISIVCLGLVVTGCSNHESENYHGNSASTLTIASEPDHTPTPTPIQKPSYPEAVENLYNRIIETGEENNLSFCIDDTLKYNISSYEFSLALSENPSANGKAIFRINENNKSFEICFLESIYGNVAPSLKLDTLKATLLYIDNSLNISDAENIITDLCGDYTGSAYSEILTLNDYNIVFVPTTYEMEFHAIYNSEIKPKDFNEANYSQGNFNSITSTLNVGKKVYLEGTVVEKGERTINGAASDVRYGSILINADDGKEYEIIVKYQELPISLSIGDKYTFYGFVGSYTQGEPCLWADYIIKN